MSQQCLRLDDVPRSSNRAVEGKCSCQLLVRLCPPCRFGDEALGRSQPGVRFVRYRTKLSEEHGRTDEIAVENRSGRLDSRGLLRQAVEELAQRRRSLQWLSDPREVGREATNGQDVRSGFCDRLIGERAATDEVAELHLNQRRP